MSVFDWRGEFIRVRSKCTLHMVNILLCNKEQNKKKTKNSVKYYNDDGF